MVEHLEDGAVRHFRDPVERLRAGVPRPQRHLRTNPPGLSHVSLPPRSRLTRHPQPYR